MLMHSGLSRRLAVAVSLTMLAGVAASFHHGPAALAAAKRTVSLRSFQTVVNAGVRVDLIAATNLPVEQGGYGLKIFNLKDRGFGETCLSGTNCTLTVSRQTPGKATYQGVILNATAKRVAASKRITVRWIKKSAWKISIRSSSLAHPNAEEGAISLGEQGALEARTATNVASKHDQLAFFAFDAQGKRRRLSTSCHSGKSCAAIFPSPTTEASWTFIAAVLSQKGKVVDESPALLILWSQLHVSLSGPNSAVAGSTAQLAASWDMEIPAAQHDWTVLVDGTTDQAATALCNKAAAQNQAARKCTFGVQASAAGSVTYQVLITPSRGALAHPLAAGQLAIVWAAAAKFTVSYTLSPGAIVPAGTTIRLQMSATPPTPGAILTITGGQTPYSCPPPTTLSCAVNLHSDGPQTTIFTIGVQGDPGSNKQLTITWTRTCANTAATCLNLNPDAGLPSSVFTATWVEAATDACDGTGTVTFFFDGQAISAPQADGNGWASVQVTTTNQTLGNHTVSAVDSCGERASTTYMVFGGG